MTIYIDDYQFPATINGVTAVWSHLMAYTDDELRAFAHQLGIHRPSTHRPDVAIPRIGVTDDERRRAIAAGAVAITVDQARALALARDRVEAESIEIAEQATACDAVELVVHGNRQNSAVSPGNSRRAGGRCVPVATRT